MAELLPCPFCGGEAKEVSNYLGQLSVLCECCGAKVFFIKGDYAVRKHSELRECWNTRTQKERATE